MSQLNKRLQELLTKMIEREEILPEIIENAPVIDEKRACSGWIKLEMCKSTYGEFFVVNLLNRVSITLTSEQMVDFIAYANPKWGQSLMKEIKQKEKDKYITITEIIFLWFEKHPRITSKLMQEEIETYIEKAIPKIQDAPFNIFFEFDTYRSLSSFLLNHILNPGLLYLTEETYIQTITQQKQMNMLSYCDQILILFREELGVHSLKEVESMESALCYLLYRTEWIGQHETKPSICFAKMKEFASYFESHPNNTFYEFFGDTGGFDGELWPSYEEFLHDEWLDDDLELINVMFHKDKELYTQLRERALQKKDRKETYG